MSNIGLEQIRSLQTEEGRRALAAAAAAIAAGQVIDPATITRLRASFPQAMVSAALTLSDLRSRARGRFARADEMFFDGADLLEQATSEPVARHKAARFAGLGTVADLCCGAGGDALAIAGRAGLVVGVDRTPSRLVCLLANAEVYGVAGRLRAVAADIEQWVPSAEACHIDPPRRDERGRRQLAAEQWDPWIERVRELAGRFGGLGGKFSPAAQIAQLAWADEVEFISENGTLKQATAWCGKLARARRSATVIRSGEGRTKVIETLASDEPLATPRQAGDLREGLILHEPDSAVVRAGLLGNLAEQVGAGLVDLHLPLLTSVGKGPLLSFSSPLPKAETLLARRYEVLEAADWSSKKVRQLVRSRGWHVAEVKTRAFACPAEEIQASMRSAVTGPAGEPVVLWVVRLGSRPKCIVTRRVTATTTD